eukprot:g26909.t1
MPGFGSSPGTRLGSRSELNNAKGGPLDICCAVLDALGVQKANVVGYDWGAGIALSMALLRKTRVNKIVPFHPSYSPPKGENLGVMPVPVLVLWVKEDQFHNLTKWRKHFQALPSSKRELEVYSLGSRWKPGMSLGSDPQLGPQLQRRILAFLAGEVAAPVAGALEKRLEAKAATAAGQLVVHAQNVVVADALADAGDVAKQLREVADPTLAAVQQFKELWSAGRLAALYAQRLTGSSASSAALFGALPEMSPEALSDPNILVNLGLWSQAPEGWERMRHTPRYCVGRKVLVRQKVIFKPSDSDFMCVSSSGADRTTSKAELKGKSKENADTWLVEVTEAGDYSSPLCRAKLCEIALALSPVVKNLDFNTADGGEAVQLKALEVIRSSDKMERYGEIWRDGVRVTC